LEKFTDGSAGRKARNEESPESYMESGSMKAKKEETVSEGEGEIEATDDDFD
jgi:hypothetical protein